MKKTTRIIAAVLVLATMLGLCALLSGCASLKIVGTWKVDGESYFLDEDMEVVLEKGGKGIVKVEGEFEDISWKYSNKKLTISIDFDDYNEKIEFKVSSLTNKKAVLIPKIDGKYDKSEKFTVVKKAARSGAKVDKKKLIGTWEDDRGYTTITFNSNGTGVLNYYGEDKFHWTLDGDELRLRYDEEDNYGSGYGIYCYVSLKGDKLVLDRDNYQEGKIEFTRAK